MISIGKDLCTDNFNHKNHNSFIGYNISGNINDFKLKNLIDDNANFIQIFTSDPCNYRTTNFKLNKHIEYFLKTNNINLVIHGSFLINLARKPDDKITQNSINLLKRDLKISNLINALGVIIHMGKNTQKLTYEDSINMYIHNLNSVINSTTGTIILETGAGCGSEICSRFNELAYLRNSCIDKSRIKFCIDTCHIYAAGYDLTNKDFVLSLESYIDITLGWENVCVAHINDSKDRFNSRKDRHHDIGFGDISNNSFECFIIFINFFIKRNIPIILETPSEKSTYGEQIKLILENKII
jgi:deoxyribonuclease-4